MITKENILVDLINFSNCKSPLDKNYFYKKHNPNQIPFTEFENKLHDHIHDLQCDQIDASVASQPFYMIFQNENGYYIARSREEAISGNEYYLSKVKSILSLTSNFSKMIQVAYPVNDPRQLNLL